MNFCLHSHRLLLGVMAIIFVTECHLVLLDVQQTREQVLDYVGRYTHRVAISNKR